MPATEQYWRNVKTMHVVFGASALVMAIATLWMASSDHNREWKDWQLKDRRKEAWMAQSRRDALAAQFDGKMREFDSKIRQLDSQPLPPEIVKRFKASVIKGTAGKKAAPAPAGDEDDRVAAGRLQVVTEVAAVTDDGDKRFDNLDDAVAELAKSAEEVNKRRAEVERIQAELDALQTAHEPAAEGEAADADAAKTETEKTAPVDNSEKIEALREELGEANEQLREAEDDAIANRREALAEFDKFIREARRLENRLVSDKKTQNGIRTAKVSELGIKIGEGADRKVIDKVQNEINSLDEQLATLTANIASARDFRMELEALVAEADAEKTLLVKSRDTITGDLDRLDEQVAKNTTNVGEWITRLPVLNALYNGNIRIEQDWLPDLTINYNFAQAARFDRCITCHRSIAKTAPGTATDPMYPTLPDDQRNLSLQLATPAEQPASDASIRDVYGLELSDSGMFNNSDVTVHYVLPETPAARAGLESGDVIDQIDGTPMQSKAQAEEYLKLLVPWGSTTTLAVERGLSHPYTSHPRLDLFLTDSSPHPEKVVGCTVCHDGQGGGTSFKWTSHTPNNASQQNRWAGSDLKWFDNHHWIFPMRPERFVESNCLKCHHQKGSLEPSERFPAPPAPKLVEGWTLVEEFGCFGCHEINGFDSPVVTVGPDVRLEPTFHEAAAQLSRLESLTDEQRELAASLSAQPDNDDARRQLMASFSKPSEGEEEGAEAEAKTDARQAAEVQKLANLLKDVETPGKYRKVGPSLRHLDSKVNYDWLYSWIRKPSKFRPSTRMPQFFQQYEHLSEDEDMAELAESQRFEPIEIRALAEYLLNASDKFEYLAAAEGVEPADAERGKWVFQSRGCLACHTHSAFPGIAANQGPDLSTLAGKLDNAKGRKWLYSWVKEPQHYHPRTKMPDLFLDPAAETNLQGQPTGVVTDPAADVVAFLLGVETDWKPKNVPQRDRLSEAEEKDLQALAQLWLSSDAIPASRAKEYVEGAGIPSQLAPRLKADELLLVDLNDDNRNDRLLAFVGRRTIGKYGCFGCHDIPGFEDAKPIGTALVDWGRKETSKLAFENIHKFLETHGIDPENPTRDVRPLVDRDAKANVPAAEGGAEGAHAEDAEHAAAHGHLDPGSEEFSADESYFIQSLNSHGRDGFLWQKLRYPRSYDYKTTHNKNYNERLRMPRFPFSDAQREAVMTFVLGLVKEPPAAKYIYKPNPRQQAIVDGRQVLEQFNCAGCHTLKMEQWEFDYAADTFESPSEVTDYPFLAPHFSDKEIAQSTAKDYRGMLHASLQGEPVMDETTGEKPWVDEDRAPITKEELLEAEKEEGAEIPVYFRFTPWRNTLLGGEVRLRGVDELLIPANRDEYGPANGKAYPAWGGDLARYLFTKVIEQAREANPQVNGREAWGWLPPPLMDEGVKVQPDWLHGFLMDPTPIRPAVVLRMPNFHMSSREAAKLVDYFAASSGAEFPYEYKPQRRAGYLERLREERENPLGEAMNIVTNGTYCVKCHAVADYQPQGDPRTFGPNLADVYGRLRPNFMRNWIANPARILPYTGMPVNIPYKPDDENLGGVSQDLFHGTSVQQLTGLVDLLMNFDAYARGNTSVTPLVQEAAAHAAEAAGPEGQGGAPGEQAEEPPAEPEPAQPDEEGSSDSPQ